MAQETMAKCPGNPVKAAPLSFLDSSIDIDGYVLQIFDGKYRELLHMTSQPGLKNG